MLILTGHDHASTSRARAAPSSSTGARSAPAAPSASGEQKSGFALVHLDENEQARAVDLVEVEPESGSASAHRVVLTVAEPAEVAGEAGGS